MAAQGANAVECKKYENMPNIKSEKNTDKDENEKKAKKGTCGYSERYGGGYSTSENITPEIRDAANNMGSELRAIAKKMGVEITQKKGYFNFGAGIQIHGEDYILNIPTAFEYKTNYFSRELIAYSKDCAEDYRQSPVIIEIERVKLPFVLTAEELFSRQKTGAELTGRKYKELSINGLTLTMTTEKRENFPLVNRLAILKPDGKELFNLIITFRGDIENADEVTKRIYFSFYFTDYGEKKQ
ncbi:MAG: hypothetical protein ACI4I4_07200 [Acutalibacteraceae bacterium]